MVAAMLVPPEGAEFDDQLPSQETSPLLHPHQPPGWRQEALDGSRIEPNAFVSNHKAHRVWQVGELNNRRLDLSVPCGVGEGLLGDAEQGSRLLSRESPLLPIDDDGHLKVGPSPEFASIPA